MIKTLLAVIVASWAFQSPVMALETSERGLVVVLNMYTGENNAIMNQWYKSETSGALLAIALGTHHAYAKTKLLYRDEAKLSGLVEGIRELNEDPNIKAIDLIVYVHGRPDSLKLVYEGLGLLHPLTEWTPIQEITDRIKKIGSRKLRVVFSDACYSKSHNDKWLDAGFKVSSGSIAEDENQSKDLVRFLARWVKNQSFKIAIEDSNREMTYPVLDKIMRGFGYKANSRKEWLGDDSLTIDSAIH